MTTKEYNERRKHTKNDIPYLKAIYGHRCAYCGVKPARSEDLEIHHIIPLDEGGQDTIRNLIPLCSDCHQKAHRKEIDWLELFNMTIDEVTLHLAWKRYAEAIERAAVDLNRKPLGKIVISATADVNDDIERLQVECILKGKPFYYKGGTMKALQILQAAVYRTPLEDDGQDGEEDQ